MALFIFKLAVTLFVGGLLGSLGLAVAHETFDVWVKPYWKYTVGSMGAGVGLVFFVCLIALWKA